MRVANRYLSLPALLLLALHNSVEAELALTFPGLAQPTVGSVAHPDAVGAAGPGHFAQFANGGFAVYGKSDGSRTAFISDQTFWIEAGTPTASLPGGVIHPRIAYDAHSQRWFATQITTPSQNNNVLLAVTTGSDPSRGNWRAVSFPAPPPGPPGPIRFGDYPTLGLDANGVYLATQNRFSRTGADRHSNSLFSIPKADLTSAAGPSLARMTRFDGSTDNQFTQGFVLQPVVDWSPVKGDGHMFAISSTDFDQIMRTPVRGAAAAAGSLGATESISTQMTWTPSPVRQPDGTGSPPAGGGLNLSDHRLASSVYQVGHLVYLAHQIGQPLPPTEEQFPDRTGVRWTVLRITDGSSTQVVAEGTISDPGYDFFQPAIAANAAGDVMLVYNRSGPSADGAINAFYSAGSTAPDGSITFGLPKQITHSTVTDYHNPQEVWGLYSSVTPDPSDPNAFWAVQEVPRSGSTWGTQVTKIVVPEPSAVTVCAVAGCLLLSRHRRKGKAEAAPVP
jgi:hypothetical protein